MGNGNGYDIIKGRRVMGREGRNVVGLGGRGQGQGEGLG